MARVIWQGAISFSLIHIPVALHSASRSNTLDLDLLDRRDFSPVGYQRVNKKTGKDVEWDDIVKGYQHQPGEYVALTDEDFRLANVEATRTIDIAAFVDPAEIAPAYYETPYYLSAGKRGEQGLCAVPRRTDRGQDRGHRQRGDPHAAVRLRTRRRSAGLWCSTRCVTPTKCCRRTSIADAAKGKTAQASKQELEMAMQLVAR